MVHRVEELLPIGSVVLLCNSKTRLMIFGILQKLSNSPAGEGKQYDYVGVPYPAGNMGQDHQYLFNHSDIEQIIFRGYEDEERQKLMTALQAYVQNHPAE